MTGRTTRGALHGSVAIALICLCSTALAGVNYTGTLTGTDICPIGGIPGPADPETVTLVVSSSQPGGPFTGSILVSGDGNSIPLTGGVIPDGSAAAGTFVDSAPPDTSSGSFTIAFNPDSTITLFVQGTDITTSEPPLCNFFLSGLLTLSSVGDGTILNPEETTGSVVTESEASRAQVVSVIDQVGGRIQSAVQGIGAGVRKTATGYRYEHRLGGGERGAAAGDGLLSNGTGVWLSYSYNELENEFSLLRYDGSRHNVLAGMDVTPWESVVVGVAVGYENGSIDTNFNRGEVDSDGFTVVPYIGAILFDNWSVDALFGYSEVESDQFRTTPGAGTRVTSSVDTTRKFIAGNLHGIWEFDRWSVGTTLGVLYSVNDQESFTESDGTRVGGQRSKLGQARIGGNVAYTFNHWQPFASLTYAYDYAYQELEIINSTLQPANDDDDFTVVLGLRYFGQQGLSGSVEYRDRLDRDEIEDRSFSLTVRWDF